MKTKYCLIVVLSFSIALCIFSGAALAEIHKMNFNAWTGNFTDPADQRMCFWFDISDTNLRPPDAVTSLMVQAPAPDNTIFDLTDHTWQEFDQGFWFSARAGDFKSGAIPSGTYRARVIDTSGKQIIGSDYVSANFLEPPDITYPTDGSTLSSLTPTIMWTSVPGAMRYRIILQYEYGDPIYWYSYHRVFVYRNSFPIPKGALKPGNSYLIRIEARDSDKDLDKRSRSDWVQFFTP